VRIRFVLAASALALAAVACSSVVSGKGAPGTSIPTGPSVPTVSLSPPGSLGPSGLPSSSPSAPITGFPSSTPAISPVISSVPPPSVSPSLLPSVSSTPPPNQADFKCPYIVFPATHLSFVCVAKKMKENTKAKPWPIVWEEVVAHFGAGGKWTLDTGAGHWGKQGSDSLRDIAVQVRNRMVSLSDYGNPAPTVRTGGKSIEVSGDKAYELRTTFTINAQFRQQNQVPIKHEKSWIVAVKVGSDDVSLWYVSVPDAVRYLWPQMDALISTISAS
jgi:hypothetical protein